MKNNNLENEIKMSDISKEEIFTIFSQTKIYHGILINSEEKNTFNQSILFKLIYSDEHLNFLLYDYQNIYFSKQSKEEISELNKRYNPTILHKDFESLIEFISNNFIIENENLIINSKLMNNKIEFEFSSKLEILWVKYSFLSECINKEYLIELSQNLFIKPMNNFLLSIQNLISSPNDIIINNSNQTVNAISYSDIKHLIKNAYINNNKGFNNHLSELMKDSSIAVNKLNEKMPIVDAKKNIPQIEKNSKKNLNKNKSSKKRKGEKVYIEDEESDNNTDKNDKKDNISLKEENKIKDKEMKKSKKKKMKFI